MSYDIYIGEPKTVGREMRINKVTQASAPEFGFEDISGKGNSRHPGYSQMTEFCKTTGLYKLFFDKVDGLLRKHPGCCPIEKEHLNTIREARLGWEAGHPGCKELLPTKDKEPDFNDHNLSEGELEGSQYDWFYAKLIWYEFWFEWALKNCKKPSILNS